MTDSTETDSLRITELLARWSNGEKAAYDQLLAHLYGDIHAIAVRQLHRERYLTIRHTALVHEVYVCLSELRQMRWQDRAHFLSMAARVKHLEIEGYVLIPDLLAAEEVAKIKAELDQVR